MELLLLLPVLLFSIVLHEYAHGWVALQQGDSTAYQLGRLTFNPIPHIDLLGSIVVPLLLWMMPGGFLFGWAKPVPVNSRNFDDYTRGDILVSLAGITANLLLAFACMLAIVLLIYLTRVFPWMQPTFELLRQMAWYGIFINLILAFFNLIPIPPLDGSHVLYHALPPDIGARYRSFGRYGILALMAIIFLVPGLLGIFLWPVTVLRGLAHDVVRLLV